MSELLLALALGAVLLAGACAPYDVASERASERQDRAHDGGMGGDHNGGGHM